MTRFSKRLTTHRFVTDVATLSSGKAFAAIIRGALVPIIARLYLPEHYGLAALFVSSTTVLAPLGILSFPQAMVLPEREEESVGLAVWAVAGLLCLAVLLWLAILMCNTIGLQILPQLAAWLWAVPVAVGLQGVLIIAENWLTCRKAFALSAAGDVTQTVTTTGLRVGAGIAFSSAVWPLIGSIISGYLARLVVYRDSLAHLARVAVRLNARMLLDLGRE
ncbi:MAG: hypothetical protein ACE5IK_02265, partial [Acidobacteriota bacterium]